MRLVLLTVGIAAKMLAQDADEPPKQALPINGFVLDRDTRQPVEGAQVRVFSSSAIGSSSPFAGVATSGASGEFQIRAVQGQPLSIAAVATHYQYSLLQPVHVEPGQSTVYIELLLDRLQTLQGMLVDEETRKPLRGIAVELLQAHPEITGALMPGSQTKAVSGADGRFVFSELPRAEYFLRISDKPAVAIEEIPAKDLEGEGRDKALESPEGAVSYGTIVWPGPNADIPPTPGIMLGSSAVDVGEIRLSRTRLTNLTGLAGPCEEGASVQIKVSGPSAASALGLLATGDLTCGEGFRLLNLPEGTFTLTALQGFPQRRWVSQIIDSRARSPVRLALNAFVHVEISAEMEDGKIEDLPEGWRVTLSSSNQAVKVDQPAILRAGTFEATLYPGEQYKISIQAGPKYYLKHATYNAAALPDGSSFTASTAGVSQLNLVVSNKAASVRVYLTHNGSPLQARSIVYLLKDGMNAEDFLTLLNRIPLVSGNALDFPGLGPGTYRVIRPSDDGVLPTTQALFDAMLKDPSRQSMPVTVEEGQTATINWEIP